MPPKEMTNGAGAPPVQQPRSFRRPIPAILRPGNAILLFMQELFNKIFPPAFNPFYILGAITFFLLWIVMASGLYLYLFYDISATRAYTSVQYITETQKYYGGIMRSLHRYASDAFVFAILLHVIQVFFSDRFRKNRWVAWVSGAAILFPIWLDGVTGYFLVWDEKAQMVAQITAELLDVLPLSTEPMSRNFLTKEGLHFLVFFVITYVHITIPFLLIGLLWVHCMRVSRPNVNPPAPVGWVIFISFMALSLVKPALSMPPADLAKLLGTIEMDWFYFLPYYLISDLGVTPKAVWLWGFVLFVVFTAMPWLIPDPKRAVKEAGGPTTLESGQDARRNVISQGKIELDLEKCKGCVLCFQACPFEAVDIITRPGVKGEEVVVNVVSDRCAECGFCVSACEFNGLSMSGQTKSDFQNKIEEALSSTSENGAPKGLAFICERSVDLQSVLSPDGLTLAAHTNVAVIVTPCIGVVSPAMVDYARKGGAKAVAVVGCRPLDCHYRETRRRMSKDRSSVFLVEEMKTTNLKTMLVSPFEAEKVIDDVGRFIDEAGKSGVTAGEGRS